MFCKHCGNKIDENSSFCSNCGEKVVIDTETSESTVVDTETTIVEAPPKERFSDKTKNIINKILFGTLISGISGVVLFLGIIVVGLIAYGRVYLFDGYDFTKVLSIISIILMMIGVCGAIAKILFVLVFKVGTFPTTIIKRILVIVLAVACLGFSIWGFVDCSNSNDDDYSYSGGGSTYISFYTIYSECNCSYPWAEVDSSYLSIDTNPYDYDSDSSSSTTYASKALNAIKQINSKLGVPSYVYEEMMETRAMDGRQTYSGTKVNISWRYHPDSGLEVRYTR